MNNKIYKNNFLAFSLIELSIVLIVIGFLIAGVTAGSSLIETAKIRSLTTEFSNWDKAVNSFYSLNDRLPSDVNRDGAFGKNANDNYEHYFPAPYNGSKYPIPKDSVAPFIDLYLHKIIDFEPIYSNETYQVTGMPTSKILKNGTNYYFMNLTYSRNLNIDYLNNFYEGHVLLLSIRVDNKYRIAFAKKLDNKIDDNSPITGRIRVRLFDANNSQDNYNNINPNAYISVIAYKLEL